MCHNGHQCFRIGYHFKIFKSQVATGKKKKKLILHSEMEKWILCLNRFVRIVYIKCADSDGSFDAPVNVPCDADSAVKRLALNARLLQTFTAESLYQHGLGHKTFRIEEDESFSPKVHIFTSKLMTSEALAMTGDQLYDTFHKGEYSGKKLGLFISHLIYG